MTARKRLTLTLRRFWPLSLCFILLGCGPSPTEQIVASSDLILLAEGRVENGHKSFFATEILRNRLTSAVRPKVGDKLVTPPGAERVEGALMLFYQEKSGNLSWRMTAPAVGEYASLAAVLRNNAGNLPPSKPPKVANIVLGILCLIGAIMYFVAIIWAAKTLDSRWLLEHPNQKHFRWGYFQAIGAVVGGPGWLVALIVGFDHWIYWPIWFCQGVVAPFAGYTLIKRKKRWAWFVVTIFQFNLLTLIINYFYGRNRWTEFAD